MILNPYFLAGLLVAFLIVFGSGYDLGAKHARNKASADQLEAVDQARIEAEAQAKTDQKTAQRYEATRETVRTVYIKIKEKAHENIEKNPDYSNCSLDADGLRLYNARPGDSQIPATGADSRVSGSAGSVGWQAVNHFDEQPGALATVLRLPGAPQSIDGMGHPIAAGKPEEIAQAEQ